MVAELVKRLNALGIGRFWEQPTGAAYRENQLIHYGLVGCADISGVLLGGKRAEIEVKSTATAPQSPGQKRFQKMMNDWGGLYVVARDIEETVLYLKTAVTGQTL